MSEEINLGGTEKESAIFNMAIAQLQLINAILKQISTISCISSEERGEEKETLTPGKAQHGKYKLVRQLFLQSIPLLDKTDGEWKKQTYEKIKAVKLKVIPQYANSKIVGYTEGFDPALENLLDDFVIDIIERLQVHKYFMPPKKDPRFGWSQD
jgi:hypothetical protein